MLKGKKIILGVTASIAAYKAPYIIRLLIKEKAEVKVIITPMARKFVTPVTLSALSNNPVLIDFFSGEDGIWNSHVELGNWADLFLVAPLTATTMGKMVNGIADNLLVATYLSAKCPVMLAPAMDFDMYKHPSTARNLEILKSYGNLIIEPATGELASGLHGKGRMEEPEIIVKKVIDFFKDSDRIKKNDSGKLVGKKILITAGPTHEPIDPVRYISNHSSGKMGYAIAETCADHGAVVTLVCGPAQLDTDHPGIEIIRVVTTREMYNSCIQRFKEQDMAILAAAVSDYTPASPQKRKIQKGKETMVVELKPTIDIAAELGKRKTPKQVLAGFAVETHDEVENAKIKLHKKNFDFIVLNSLKDPGAGFGHDTNKITIIDKDNKIEKFELKSKKEVAEDIVDKLEKYII